MTFLFLHYAHEARLRPDGGGFRKPWLLAENLAALGHGVHVVGPRVSFQTSVSHTFFRLPPVPLLRPLWAYAAQFVLGFLWALKTKPDVVYARSSSTCLPAFLSKMAGGKFLLEINGDAVAEMCRDGRLWRARVQSWIERINVRMADRVVVLTEGLSRAIRSRYAVPLEKISVIPSGSDPSLFQPMDPAQCRRSLGIPSDRPTVGFLGVFYRHQGVDALLQAAPAILRAAPDAQFLLVGDGPARLEWEDTAQRLGLKDKCLFIGQIPYERAPLTVGAMDVAVAPFTADRGETSPLKIFDYLASGRPVVAHRIPSLESFSGETDVIQWVDPGSSGCLAEAIIDLLKNPVRRRELGERGRQMVEARFSWRQIARKYEALFAPSLAGGLK